MQDARLACRYFDGVSSRPWPVSIAREGGNLRIAGEHVDRTVDASALDFVAATDRGPARIAFADGGLCEIDDRPAADALFASFGYRPARVDRMAARTRHAVLIAVAFVAVMGALYVWGVPFAADTAVRFAPRRWDQALGDQVLNTFDDRGIFKPTALTAERRARLVKRFDALRLPPTGHIDAPPVAHADLRLAFRRLGAPNALALPGNHIVVTDEIVTLAGDDDDALLTVLAHEVGHVEHRDAMRQLARSTLASVIAAWYLGDASNAAAAVAGGIGVLRYSRDAEHRADLYALRTMALNGIGTQGAADLFRRLEAWRPTPADDGKSSADDGTKTRTAERADRVRRRLRAPEYLSTHPATEDRIRLFERGVVPDDDGDD